MTTTTYLLRGDGILAVPGRHESKALTMPCPACSALAAPVVVADDFPTRGRVVAYRCAACFKAWLNWFPLVLPRRSVAPMFDSFRLDRDEIPYED